MKELDDILKDDAKARAEEKAEKPVEEKVETKAETEVKAETRPEEKPEAEPERKVTGETGVSPTPKEAGHVPLESLLAEREKRQAAEAAARALQEELARRQNPPPPRPDQFEDPEGAAAYDRQHVEGRLLGMKIQQSRILAQKFHPDFGEVEKAYEGLRSTDPDLWVMLGNTAAQQEVPFEWLYREMKGRMVQNEVGDLTAYRKKVEEEIRAKLAEEAKAAAEARARAEIPESLADAQSSSGGRTSAFSGQTPLSKIVG